MVGKTINFLHTQKIEKNNQNVLINFLLINNKYQNNINVSK